jgi:hypothetical protein
MLAVISALREWRCHVTKHPFTLVTDHQPKVYLDNAKSIRTAKRQAWWLDASKEFEYEWQYRPGRGSYLKSTPTLYTRGCTVFLYQMVGALQSPRERARNSWRRWGRFSIADCKGTREELLAGSSRGRFYPSIVNACFIHLLV